jgi:hypothetical protein
VIASLTNGNADVTLTVKAIGETITAPNYNNNGGGNVAGAAAAEDIAVDMTGVLFQNLAELKADTGLGISLSATNVANIGAVVSDPNAVNLNLAAETITADLDLSAMSFDSANPNIGLTINSGVTVTATKDQVAATNFAAGGTGTLLIKGASGSIAEANLDLPGNGTVNASIVILDVAADMAVTTDVLTNVTGFNIQTGKTLTVNSASVTGLDVTGDGTMVMNLGTANFSLVDVAASVTATATVAADTAMHTSANLGTLVTTVNNGTTFTLLATQATGKTMNGAGNVTINTLNGSAAADLSKITVAGTKSANLADNVTFTGDLNGFGVVIANTKTLTSTAAKLTGLTITDGSDTGAVTVTALDATAAADFSNVDVAGTTTANVANDVTFTGDLNGFAVTIANGKTLTSTAAKLHNLAITDTAVGDVGSVTVTALDAKADASFANVDLHNSATLTANVANDVTFTGDLNGFAVTIADGKTLTSTAAKLTGLAITDTNAAHVGSVTVTALNATAGANFANVDLHASATKTAQVAADVTFTGTLNGFDVLLANSTTITSTAAKLTGIKITDGSDTAGVTVTALNATAAADFRLVDVAGTKTADLADDVTFTGHLNGFAVTIANTKTLTSTAEKLHNIAITDTNAAHVGNVTVTALDAKADASFANVDLHNSATLTANVANDVTFTGNLNGFAVTIANGKTLTSTAAKLHNLAITDTGGAVGSVTVTALDAKADASFANVSLAGGATKTANVANDVTFTGNLNGFAVTIDNGKTLTSTAAKLNGLAITDTGAAVGNVTVTALDATAAADFSNVVLAAGAVKTANVANDVTFTGDLGGFAVTVDNGKKLTATSVKLDGITTTDASGSATTIVSDTTYAANANLSGIKTTTIEFGNKTTDLTLGNNVTLGIRQAHLTPLVGDGGTTIGDGSDTGNVNIFEFTGAVDIAEIDVSGAVTGYVSGAQDITGAAARMEEMTALVIQSGGSLAMTQAQANAFAATLTKEAGAGNVTSTVTGDLSALNLSVVDVITLGANSILVDSTADLKAAAAINATTKLITANNTIDLTGKTITNFGSLTVDTNQVTVTAEQIHGFAAGANTVTKTNGGQVTVHVGSTADISGLDTSDATSVVLNTTNSNVTMTAAQNLQVTSGAGTNTITLSNAGTTNAVVGIENYILSSAGPNSFTMAANTAQVTGGTNSDTIIGGTGGSTIIGGAGADILTGNTGADIFSFATGHTGQTALTADRILDFATGVDDIKVNGTVGDYVEENGAAMLFSNFVTNASTNFNGGVDIYAAFNLSGTGDTYVAIDHSGDGSFGTGDTLIVLDSLSLNSQLAAGDFIA